MSYVAAHPLGRDRCSQGEDFSPKALGVRCTTSLDLIAHAHKLGWSGMVRRIVTCQTEALPIKDTSMGQKVGIAGSDLRKVLIRRYKIAE